MSQEFNFKYDQIRENERSIQHGEPMALTSTYNASYSEEGHVRNICFVCKDGNKLFLNYSYLVACSYNAESNSILLSFTSHKITIKGIFLEALFYDFMHQQLKQLVCVDPRYNVITNDELPVVNEIIILENE